MTGVTSQAIYVRRNTKALSCNQWRSGKAMSITYSACVFVALGMKHAIHMRHIAICDLLRSTIFFNIISLSKER